MLYYISTFSWWSVPTELFHLCFKISSSFVSQNLTQNICFWLPCLNSQLLYSFQKYQKTSNVISIHFTVMAIPSFKEAKWGTVLVNHLPSASIPFYQDACKPLSTTSEVYAIRQGIQGVSIVFYTLTVRYFLDVFNI